MSWTFFGDVLKHGFQSVIYPLMKRTVKDTFSILLFYSSRQHLVDDRPTKITFFPDTDTALAIFSDHEVAETKEINENIYLDLDASGNLIAMTIEHARQQASLPSLSYQLIEEENYEKNKIHR